MNTKNLMLLIALLCFVSCNNERDSNPLNDENTENSDQTKSGDPGEVIDQIIGQWYVDDGSIYFEGPPVYVLNKNGTFEIYGNDGDGYKGSTEGSYSFNTAVNPSVLTLSYTVGDEPLVFIILTLNASAMELQNITSPEVISLLKCDWPLM